MGITRHSSSGGVQTKEILYPSSSVSVSLVGNAYKEDIQVNGNSTTGKHVAPNEYSYGITKTRRWHSLGGGFIKYRELRPGDTEIYKISGDLNVNTPAFTPASWENRNAAYNLALDRLNDKLRGGLDLGVALAESGQTRRMIKSLNRVVKFAQYRRVGNFIRDASRDLSNGWLEWQYGWKPLCSDVFGALDEGLNIVKATLQKAKGRGTIRMDKTVNRIGAFESNDQDFPFQEEFEEKNSCTIGVTIEVPPDKFDATRWSSLNPLSLGWELIPYSFVVDWFFDVGSFMRNMETALLYNTRFKQGYSSEIMCSKRTMRLIGLKSGVIRNFIPYPAYRQVCDLEAQQYNCEFRRFILASYPFPRPPSFSVDLGSQRLFSAAALLRQLIKR